ERRGRTVLRQAPFGPPNVCASLVQVDVDHWWRRESVALAATGDAADPEDRAQPSHERRDALSWMGRRIAGPDGFHESVHADEVPALDGEHLQQRSRLTAPEHGGRVRLTAPGHDKLT